MACLFDTNAYHDCDGRCDRETDKSGQNLQYCEIKENMMSSYHMAATTAFSKLSA